MAPKFAPKIHTQPINDLQMSNSFQHLIYNALECVIRIATTPGRVYVMSE